MEWSDLARFAASPDGGPSLGLVYGRRRQGKTFLLDHLVRETGGFIYQALEETREAALASIFSAGAAWTRNPLAQAGGRFADWPTAIHALAEAAAGRLIVLDEFTYLLRDSGEIPSVIQRAYDDAKAGRHPPFRLLLCGSALSVMLNLLTGTKALRGRASLELAVAAFDYRQARAFWNIADPLTAFLVDAIVGGSPGYRDLLGRAIPAHADDLEAWLEAGVLNPSHALFREAEYLLTEDPTMTDRALYRSLVAAIASGTSTKTRLSNRLGRDAGSLDYPLGQLEKAHFIVREADLLRANRPLLRVVDPMLRFAFAVVRRDPRFESRQTQAAWSDAADRFASNVLGPHFEGMARTWAARYAADATVGTGQRAVGFVQVNDPGERRAFELDVAVVDRSAEGQRAVITAIGEAKGGTAIRTIGDLRRLERLRGLLAARAQMRDAKLLLFGRAGFAPDVVEEAHGRRDVELIDLERLYEGD